MIKRDIHIEIELSAPSDRVWHALTDREALSSWFMPTADFRAEIGHSFQFRMKPQRGWDGVTHCQVTEVVPGARISYTYRGEGTGEKTMACAGVDSELAGKAVNGIFARIDTVVTFTVKPEGAKTRLILDQTGWRGFKLVLISYIMQMGWRKSVFKRLVEKMSAAA